MGKLRMLGQAALVLAAWISHASLAANSQALDLTGMWVTDLAACEKIFVTKGKRTSFRKDSDVYGSGFIIEGNRIRGRMATCNIRSRKQDGDTVHLMTACATDIMLSNIQFSVKVIDRNRITRIFPGIEGMEVDYVRCPAGPKPM